jgi:IS5 family transposase
VQAEDELVADTTVQEANVTYPTETKLRERVIRRLWRLGEKKGLKWARSHKRTVPKLLRTARSRSNRQAKARRKAINKLRTMGRSLLRQYRSRCGTGLSRKEQSELEPMKRIRTQKHSEAAKDRVDLPRFGGQPGD